jgi:hypothetical protein
MSIDKEPASWLGLLSAALMAIVTLAHPSWLSAGAAGAIIALATAIVTAAVTRPVAPALFVGVLTAAVAVIGQYGIHLSDSAVGALTALLLAALAVIGVRPQVTPTTARR